ncbi:Uncharacterised protein [Vibrio cholerae]|nr:Uncharacterised protein [Vibrio cholerae]CSD64702.1 Uncharacterised protein [Vibrio cholerae]
MRKSRWGHIWVTHHIVGLPYELFLCEATDFKKIWIYIGNMAVWCGRR